MGNLLLLCLSVSLAGLWVCPQVATAEDTCSARGSEWNPSAQLRFGLIVSLRKSDRMGCGIISEEVLQLYVASQWVLDKLNKDSGNGTYVPGVQFGFDLLDDCRSPTRAMQYALDYMDIYSRCGDNQYSSNNTLRLGLVGPSRSSTAEEVTEAMRAIPVPIISPSATVATLTTGDSSHPNFFRTVPSDRVQLAAIIEILKTLNWTYVALVYTDDVYGVTGSRMLRELAARERICINASLVITSEPEVLTSVVSQLVGVRGRAKGQSVAVVYIGSKDKAENLVFTLKSQSALGFHFIFSDSVSTNKDVFTSGQLLAGRNLAQGSLTLAPSGVTMTDFEDYLNQKYTNVFHGKDPDSVVASFLKVSGWGPTLPRVSQVSFVPLAVGAVFAMAEATRVTHLAACGGTPGVCTAMVTAVAEGAVLRNLKNISVDFGAMTADVAPQAFRRSGYVIQFDKNGDIVPEKETADYTVFSYNNENPQPFFEVGSYKGGKLSLNMSQVKMLTTNNQVVQQVQTSVCAGNCMECADSGRTPVAFLNGSAFILGVFSMHVRQGDSPFKCGAYRNVSIDPVVLQAFLHGVQQLKADTGIDYGAIAFDDCYSPLRISSILSAYVSQHVPEEECRFSVCIDPRRVVGVIGSLSSGSTMAVADVFTPLRVPVISYAASSPDLDDKINFPYFLRTVPSDEEQAKVMADVLDAMSWNYVGLLYVNNNYGNKGALAFQRIAAARGICVAEPVFISENPSSVDEKDLYDAFIALIEKNVKIVIFFGIDTRMADMLSLIESRGEHGRLVFVASEEWANKADVLAAGPKAARGSITIKVNNVDIDPVEEDQFRRQLLQEVPSKDDPNPWFSEFWQNFYDCNIPGGFNNIFAKDCSPTQRLTSVEVERILSDQRVKHVLNAVRAMGWGLQGARDEFCEDGFPCSFLTNAKYAPKVLELIRSQTVTVHSVKEDMFDEKGNGNIGFSLFNIQRDGTSNSYAYKPVGSYTAQRGLQLQTENLVFYTDTGRESGQVEARCSARLCDHCPAPPSTAPTPATAVEPAETLSVAKLVLLVVLLAVCLILVCFLIVGFAYFRRKIKGLTKELQEQKNEPLYHAVQDRRVYGNVTMDMASVPLPPLGRHDRIHFVNSMGHSCSVSPADTLDGRLNPAFTPDSSCGMATAQPSVTQNGRSVGVTSPAAGRPPDLPVRQSSRTSVPSATRVARAARPLPSDSDLSQHPYDDMNSTASESQSAVTSPGRASRLPSFPWAPQDAQDIPLQVLGLGDVPDYREHQAGGQSERPRHGSEVSSIQYFQMTPTGQLEELEGGEEGQEAGVLDTYVLPQRQVPDPQVLCAQSLSPVSLSGSSRALSLSPEAFEMLLQERLAERLALYQQQQQHRTSPTDSTSHASLGQNSGTGSQSQSLLQMQQQQQLYLSDMQQYLASRPELQQQMSVAASTLYPSSETCSGVGPQHQQPCSTGYPSSSHNSEDPFSSTGQVLSASLSQNSPRHDQRARQPQETQNVLSPSGNESAYTIISALPFARFQGRQPASHLRGSQQSSGSDSGRSSTASRGTAATLTATEPSRSRRTLGALDFSYSGSCSDVTVEQADHQQQRQQQSQGAAQQDGQMPAAAFLGLNVSTV